MNAKIVAASAIMAAFTSLGSSVCAQLPEAPNVTPQDYTLTGDSLEGIRVRTAQEDFPTFFNEKQSGSISSNNGNDNARPNSLRLNETISLPDIPLNLQPAQSVNGNDGVQLQLDLREQ